MPKLHATLEPNDVVMIPGGGRVTFVEKSGKRSRVVIESDHPVTIGKAGVQEVTPPAPTMQRSVVRPTG